MKRREFLSVAGTGIAGAALAGGTTTTAGASTSSGPARAGSRIKKAVKLHMVEEGESLREKFNLLQELGFDGVEPGSPNDYSREEMLEAKEASGLEIPGVVDSVHWDQTLSDPDPKVREQGREGLKTALQDAKAYGASTVLLVPAVVNENVAYDDAYRRSQREIRRVLPMARDLGVKIAIENVWNHFLMSPVETARYIDEFDSPWIGAFFDVGNVVNYGWPEQWVRILGDRIMKLDIKEYSRSLRDEQGPYAGFDVKIGDGDCNWPEVRKALDEIGYWGWGTAEVSGGDRERLADIKQRMDNVLF
jgi:hexulose-6-phosphate isomerase